MQGGVLASAPYAPPPDSFFHQGRNILFHILGGGAYAPSVLNQQWNMPPICPTASDAYEGDSYSIINSLLNWVSCFPGFSPFLCTIFSRVSSSFCDALVTMTIIVMPFQKENINCCDYYWLNQWICSHICPFRICKNVLDSVKSIFQ